MWSACRRSRQSHELFRRAALVAALLFLNILLFVPALIYSKERPTLLFSFEYGAGLLVLALFARTRLRTPVRLLVVALYCALVLFLVYQHVFRYFFARNPTVVQDWRLLLNLFHFLSSMISLRWRAFIGGCVVFAVGLLVLADRSFQAFARRSEMVRPSIFAAAAAGWLLLGAASLFKFGFVSQPLVDNYRASVATMQKLGQLGSLPADRRNDKLMAVRLAKRPAFYLMMLEAYGEVLTTWDMTDAYRALMSRVEERLRTAGFAARTAYSAAPVHGGWSWMSIATVHTGMVIDQPESYSAFESVAGAVPTLTSFFRQQGYHTLSLQPGTRKRVGLKPYDLYGHERLVDAPALGYHGHAWGFGEIPDQYSLGTFREQYLNTTEEPRYLFFMSVSTHFPWSEVPPYVRDFKTLVGSTAEEVSNDPQWPALPGVEKIGSDYRRGYLKSIEYEWRVLLDLLEKEPSKDVVVIVVGDHQPQLESNQPGEVTFNVPIHVISRDPAFVELFDAVGFQPGMYTESRRRPVLRHEGLFSLLVSKLAEAYGTNASKAVAKYYPEGTSLGGLK